MSEPGFYTIMLIDLIKVLNRITTAEVCDASKAPCLFNCWAKKYPPGKPGGGKQLKTNYV